VPARDGPQAQIRVHLAEIGHPSWGPTIRASP
jgi:hypothetical protein